MKTSTHIVGWLLAVAGCVVYLMTLAPTVSFWDCGEFIATSYGLQVGHPPGAPFYQLVAHVFTLLAPSPERVSWWSNALSAVCGGLTVMLLYWIIRLLTGERSSWVNYCAAVAGALCYLFCDTAWFSAVESEVYGMAMLMASLLVWTMLRWYGCQSSRQASRWLVLTALLFGLSVCVHLMCLLTLPALLLLWLAKGNGSFRQWWHGLPSSFRCSKRQWWVATLCIVMFLIGLTPYLIVPIRAAANPPINYYKADDFMGYVRRDQYAHAPLYPRMWRHQGSDDAHAKAWSGGNDGFLGNACYYASYQLCYMYLRYLMWNFSGRYDARQGFGSLQHGQFITGIPPIDRVLVGTGKRPPHALPVDGRHVYYLLPFLLGLIGLLYASRYSRVGQWVVGLLFLFGGILLSLYLNHPAYEPRERDYAYVLSFWAFCIWIAWGVECVSLWISRYSKGLGALAAFLLLGVPVLMACQNWRSHDRSEWDMAYQVGDNILASCEPGSVLFTYGDNDTFPLWYLQQVEGEHTDIEVYNVNLIGGAKFSQMILNDSIATRKRVFFTHYAYDAYREFFPDRWRLSGYVYRLYDSPQIGNDVDVDASFLAMSQRLSWNLPERRDLEEVADAFVRQYLKDVFHVEQSLREQGREADAAALMKKTIEEIPVYKLCGHPDLAMEYVEHTFKAGLREEALADCLMLSFSLAEISNYYLTLSEENQEALRYTIRPYQDLSCFLTEVFAAEIQRLETEE